MPFINHANELKVQNPVISYCLIVYALKKADEILTNL